MNAAEIRTYETIDRINNSKSKEFVYREFRGFISQHGFENFILTGMPDQEEDFERYISINGWSEEWYKLYIENEFYKNDPIAAHTRTSILPFRWSDVHVSKDDVRASNIMSLSKDFRMKDGYCIPFYKPKSQSSCITMSGEFTEINEEFRQSVQVISTFVHQIVEEINNKKDEENCILSEREKEVLKWASGGKTNWEIGVILGISSRTVHGHIQSAAKKLNTCNRTSTVVRAIRSGEIPLI
ncbi:LuxR family transcriptional regulator [Stappia sp. MMSF_3263]|uniref:helix-turn-helix transcriptional regulator n=1 Tax=Stappia sp. MMSF_3263 TaxID=3046693 RepID=UPI00273D42AE|nr:LuxR family transcriptional regulator [Stappia sp. MMSF_3263]